MGARACAIRWSQTFIGGTFEDAEGAGATEGSEPSFTTPLSSCTAVCFSAATSVEREGREVGGGEARTGAEDGGGNSSEDSAEDDLCELERVSAAVGPFAEGASATLRDGKWCSGLFAAGEDVLAP